MGNELKNELMVFLDRDPSWVSQNNQKIKEYKYGFKKIYQTDSQTDYTLNHITLRTHSITKQESRKPLKLNLYNLYFSKNIKKWDPILSALSQVFTDIKENELDTFFSKNSMRSTVYIRYHPKLKVEDIIGEKIHSTDFSGYEIEFEEYMGFIVYEPKMKKALKRINIFFKDQYDSYRISALVKKVTANNLKKTARRVSFLLNENQKLINASNRAIQKTFNKNKPWEKIPK